MNSAIRVTLIIIFVTGGPKPEGNNIRYHVRAFNTQRGIKHECQGIDQQLSHVQTSGGDESICNLVDDK